MANIAFNLAKIQKINGQTANISAAMGLFKSLCPKPWTDDQKAAYDKLEGLWNELMKQWLLLETEIKTGSQ